MNIRKIEEHGYHSALLGLSLSHNKWDTNTKEGLLKMEVVAKRLAPMGRGHNKFLESIIVWLDVKAARYWWQEFDTYRVGTTKQSDSTMHTVVKQPITKNNFESPKLINSNILNELNNLINSGDLLSVKKLLPESFLQRRIICTNYMVLRNIYFQRRKHKLPEWHTFLEIINYLDKPEFITYEI